LSGRLFHFLTGGVLPKKYEDINKYLNDLIREQKIFLEVRIIKDILFIEKIEFMILEEKPYNQIVDEIIDRDDITQTIKTFKARLKDGVLQPIVSRFLYRVEREKVLIYIIWSDNKKNVTYAQTNEKKTFKILTEGDTYTLN
jgi:hypothetical protein